LALCLLFGAGAGGGEAVGVGAGFDDGAVEGEAVDDGSAEPGIGEGLGPAAAGLVGGDGDAVLRLAFGQDLEEEFGAVPVKLHVAELINAEEIDPTVAGDGLVEPLLVGGLDQLVHEFHGERVADSVALHSGFGAQGDEHVGFAGAESPIRQSGWLFLIHSQLARVWTVAASMFGLASKSKARRDFSRGKPAALIRRSERRRDVVGVAANPDPDRES
jgi:hypothetical protein